MIFVSISNDNIDNLIQMMLALWPETSYESELENCRRLLDSENEMVYMAKDNEELIAFIYLSIRNEYVEGAIKYPIAYIEGIYIKNGFRQKGLGRRLVEKAKEWAIRKECHQLASDAEISNFKSISFHKQAGFKEVNRIVNFIQEL